MGGWDYGRPTWLFTGSPFISNTRTFRHASRDITVNGIMIPKGLRVLIPIIVLHHSKEFWENPEVFRPERYVTHLRGMPLHIQF